MKATKEQIIAEANRRAVAQGYGAPPVEHFIVDVVCENWTPPEPVVDPDVLAWREWETRAGCSDDYRKAVLAGKWDHSVNARVFLAGARMAREQEQERAKGLVDLLTPAGIEAMLVNYLVIAEDRARAALAIYRGEA